MEKLSLEPVLHSLYEMDCMTGERPSSVCFHTSITRWLTLLKYQTFFVCSGTGNPTGRQQEPDCENTVPVHCMVFLAGT